MNLSVRIREELISDNTIKSTAVITDGLSRYKATAIVGVDMNQKGMQTPQKFGTASSYGKKYALGNLFLIDDTQDSDALNTHGSKPTLLAKTPQHKKVIQGLEKGYSIDDVKKKYSLTKEMEQELSKITKSIKV